MSKHLVDLKILNETEYFREITRKIKSAKKGERIAATTMSFDPVEPPVKEFMNALIDAASHGAKVLLLVDAYSFLANSAGIPNGPLFRRQSIHSAKNGYYGGKLKILNELEDAGGEYHVINVPKTKLINPVAGRSHIKTAIVGDELYMGGCNLSGTNQVDLMVCTKDETSASYILELIDQIVKTGNAREAMQDRDSELALDGRTSLLIDSGVSGQSLIYEQALEMIDEADEWLVMTCQYFPNSKTARHLSAARDRGVRVQLFYNHPKHHDNLGKLAHRLVIWQERTRHHKELFSLQGRRKQRRIHAKLIATEKGAIIGSHNYVTAGVRLGTAEAAILRRDPAFAQQATQVIEKSLGAK